MARTIDGFMPRASVLPHPQLAPHNHDAPPAPRTPVKPLSRTVLSPRLRPQQPAKPTAAAPAAAPIATPSLAPPIPVAPTRRVYAASAPVVKRRRGIPERLQLPLIIIGAILAGMFAQSAIFGELMVVAYGIVALIWRIASRTTFTLALLSMVATTLLLVVRGNVALAQNFATYTFLLLVVGVITLTGELKKEGGRIYNNRKNIT